MKNVAVGHIHLSSLKQQSSSCCSHREMNGSGKNSTVRFNDGLSTGSTEMLHATKFYQNCVDEDTESRWMEVYEEQKTAWNGQENELITSKLSTRSVIETGKPKLNNSGTFLVQISDIISKKNIIRPIIDLSEKTHSAEPRGGNLSARLHRCDEMENIDKVALQG
uniref:BAALC binder of MAP3K1 and KLF4 b n=1 Tax=Elaeophora elaphi TaxID=1147741 RepID=A0A0R3RHA5_9BILA